MNSFWDNRVQQLLKTHLYDEHDKMRTVIVDGNYYFVKSFGRNPEKNTKFLGFAGRMFKIRFNNGAVVETNDLWHNGKIPHEYKDQLQDNAVFL